MSKFHYEYLTCPYCLSEENIVVWDEIDAGLDPDLKKLLLRKEAQRFECRNCGRTHILAKTLLYRDPARDLLVWNQADMNLKADRTKLSDLLLQLPAIGPAHLRAVFCTNELNEKIHIFDHGLDDRIMEIVKLAILNWQKEEIKIEELYFLSREAERMLFLAQTVDKEWYQLPVDARLYESIELQLLPQLPLTEGWQIIDSVYAQPFFNLIND